MKEGVLKTHTKINQKLSGIPINISNNGSTVSMIATQDMAADESGLVHGGFLFSMADYAAMIAVNHPNVVLGSASIRFLKPIVVGDSLVAVADIVDIQDKKQIVNVKIRLDSTIIFEGKFTCIIPKTHVLDPYQ